ncbi:MAG TPA: hypothetical protein VJT31_06180 [Rugosimonospora sp.]|nr:hypothetical protein [Rugosimonospora sp.]
MDGHDGASYLDVPPIDRLNQVDVLAPRGPIRGATTCACRSDMSIGPWKLRTSISMAGLWVHEAIRPWNAADIATVHEPCSSAANPCQTAVLPGYS